MTDPLRAIGSLIDILPDAVLLVDASGRIVKANAAVESLLGHDPARLCGQPLDRLIPADVRARHEVLLADYVERGHAGLMTSRPVLQALHHSGAVVQVSISLSTLDLPEQRLAVAVIRDASNVHDQLEKATAQAETDPLTGIGNRLRMSRRMFSWMQAERPFALLYFDLTAFKPLNDLYGHRIGDEVLRLVARRTLALVREGDLAVRVGGDEFVILIDGLSDAQLLETRARSVAASLTRPFSVGDVNASVGVSIGGAVFPRDARTESDLLAVADANMYRAKQAGQSYWLAPES